MTHDPVALFRNELRANFETGEVYRDASKQRPDLVGSPAGYKDNCGYVRISVAGRKYLRSHIVFALFYGRMPTSQIDHINRNRADDRPCNLREVTHEQNMWNRTPTRRDLPMGVNRNGTIYQARIMKGRKRYYLGSFRTPEQAKAAYLKARKELFGGYA